MVSSIPSQSVTLHNLLHPVQLPSLHTHSRFSEGVGGDEGKELPLLLHVGGEEGLQKKGWG